MQLRSVASVVSNSSWSHDCSLLSSSVHEILQARILEWVAISFFRGSSRPKDRPRDRTQIFKTIEYTSLSFSEPCLGSFYPNLHYLLKQNFFSPPTRFLNLEIWNGNTPVSPTLTQALCLAHFWKRKLIIQKQYYILQEKKLFLWFTAVGLAL